MKRWNTVDRNMQVKLDTDTMLKPGLEVGTESNKNKNIRDSSPVARLGLITTNQEIVLTRGK